MKSAVLPLLAKKGIRFKHTSRKCVAYHGTNRPIAIQILKRGFDFAFCGERLHLGTGFYFFDTFPEIGWLFALCYAIHVKKASQPVAVEADLTFDFLLDLNEAHNGRLFWDLKRLLKQQSAFLPEDGKVDELFVAWFVGTKIADEMRSDGVAWRFPLQETVKKAEYARRKQHGFVVKKLGVIGRPRIFEKANV